VNIQRHAFFSKFFFEFRFQFSAFPGQPSVIESNQFFLYRLLDGLLWLGKAFRRTRRSILRTRFSSIDIAIIAAPMVAPKV
jgi:hypothetical protein